MGEKATTYQIVPNNDQSLRLTIDDHHHDRKPSVESSNSKSNSNKQFLKYISLVTLTIQNASLNLFMRAARTQKDLFNSSTAVIMAELLKLLTCFIMVYREEGNVYTRKQMLSAILTNTLNRAKL